jgi:hypothetical protein
VNLVAVSVDPADTLEVLREYRQTNGYPWTVAPGNREIVERYNVITTMSKYAIDRRGTIAFKGGHTVEDDRAWERAFEELARR